MNNALTHVSGTAVLHTDCLSAKDLQRVATDHHACRSMDVSQSQTDPLERGAIPRAHVHFTSRLQSRPVLLISRQRAFITTAQSYGIAHYAGISQSKYLQICYLAAMTQLRALAENTIQEPEYFECQMNRYCLFSWHRQIEDYAQVFENRIVCDGCRSFYSALGVESELIELIRTASVVSLEDPGDASQQAKQESPVLGSRRSI